MRQWFTNYWSGKHTFFKAFWVWGILANIAWHMSIVIMIAYYIVLGIEGWVQPGNMALVIFLCISSLGLLQALVCMPISLKVLFSCYRNSPQTLSAKIILAFYTPYAVISFIIGFFMLVLMPIWWNR